MRILIIANDDVGLYRFRRELIEELLKTNEVHICLPDGECILCLKTMGCIYHAYEFDCHGTNLFAELKQLFFYKKLLKLVKPDVVLTYTIKPNVYAGIACASMNVPYIANITGLGIAIEKGGTMQKLLLVLYKYGLRKAQMVFFQNETNRSFMLSKGVIKGLHELLPGSGVNLKENRAEEYPKQESPLILVTVGRIMKDKGTDEVLYAARMIRKEYPNVIFRLIGDFDGAYQDLVNQAVANGEIEYLGQQSDVHAFLKDAHAIVHASYHEGMSNVLLEAAACARPIIATDVAGCREIYDDGISGISCKARDGDDLVRAIKEFISLSHNERAAMGIAGRQKVESEFDRNIVIRKYLEEIRKVEKIN